MKRSKIKVLTIVCALLIATGCGQGADGSTTEFSSMQSAESGTVAVQESVAGAADAQDSQTEASDTEPADTEEAPYVLTFEAVTTEGETVTSDCFTQSKLTMLNIWGTYCNPCLMEMPDLGEIAASYETSEFQLIGIVCDVMEGADEADIENAKALIEETGANYPHLLLSESLYTNLVGATDAVPTTFFVNQKGEVLGYVVGANSKETWVDLIEQLLAEQN